MIRNLVFFSLLLSCLSTSAQLSFRENKGQLADMEGNLLPDVLFEVPNQPLGVYIRKSGISYIFHHPSGDSIFLYRMDMELAGANPAPVVERFFPQKSHNNYYLSHCPEGILGVKDYEKVRLNEVYPGIDWEIYAEDGQLKYDFILAPGADPAAIQLVYKGAEAITSQSPGMIDIRTGYGSLTEGQLQVLQGDNQVPATFSLEGNTVRFDLGSYDPNLELVIDPPVYWGTLWSSGASTYIYGMDLAPNGELIHMGASILAGFPAVNPGGGAWYDPTNGSNVDMYFSRLDVNRQVIWATHYGGTGAEVYGDIHVDPHGNIWACGRTRSTNFPLFNPGSGAFFQGTWGGGNDDGYMVCFDGLGVRKWATFYGGVSHDEITGIAHDDSSNIYMAGESNSSTGLTTFDPGGNAYFDGSFSGSGTQAVLLEFDTTFTMKWGTLFGGPAAEDFEKIVVTSQNEIFVAGNGSENSSGGLPIVDPGGGAFIDTTSASSGPNDFIFAKFAADHSLVWSTYMGGASNETGYIDLDADTVGNIYFVGMTNGPGMQTVNPGSGAFYQPSHGGSGDVFLARFSTSCVLEWASFLGGSQSELAGVVSCDVTPGGDFYILGGTNSSNFPVVNPGGGTYFEGTALSSSNNIFISQFDTAAVMIWSTFFGGSGSDFPGECLLDPAGNLLIGGVTYSTDFPFQNPSNGWLYDTVFVGSEDPFFAQFGNAVVCNIAAGFTANATGFCLGDTLLLSSTSSGASTLQWKVDGQAFASSTSASLPMGQTGTRTITLVAEAGQCQDSTSLVVETYPQPGIGISATPAAVCQGESFLLSASGGNGAYNFQGPGLSVSGVPNTTVTPAGSATYYVTYTDSNGCEASDSLAMIVNPLPVINLMTSSDSVCRGNTFQLTATGGGPNYDFSGPGFSASGVPSATVTAANSGFFTVAYTDMNGCSDVDSLPVTVLDLPSLSLGVNPDSLCAGDTLILTASGGIGIFDFSGPGFNLTGVASGMAVPSMSGPVHVTAYSGQGCTSVDTTDVVVIPLPAVPTISQSGPVLTSSATSGNQWYFNSMPIPGATGQTYTATQDGQYSVTVTNSAGCAASSAEITVVLDRVNADLLNHEISLFPNPATEMLVVRTERNLPGYVRMELISMEGKILQAWEFPEGLKAGDHRIRFQDIPEGTYGLRITTADKMGAFLVVIRQ